MKMKLALNFGEAGLKDTSESVDTAVSAANQVNVPRAHYFHKDVHYGAEPMFAYTLRRCYNPELPLSCPAATRSAHDSNNFRPVSSAEDAARAASLLRHSAGPLVHSPMSSGKAIRIWRLCRYRREHPRQEPTQLAPLRRHAGLLRCGNRTGYVTPHAPYGLANVSGGKPSPLALGRLVRYLSIEERPISVCTHFARDGAGQASFHRPIRAPRTLDARKTAQVDGGVYRLSDRQPVCHFDAVDAQRLLQEDLRRIRSHACGMAGGRGLCRPEQDYWLLAHLAAAHTLGGWADALGARRLGQAGKGCTAS
ncbi:hypothetical protein NUW54_g11305 [Trametes sanguinea]|uniref:Uncharacterized protein n=1 Tax=Trametes sanguinea TaxID=158606 RepID=A0ACC1NIE7_9APHY|nr:hypothetical protein NUW54_g11305 [Trametes sanguinea]